MQNYFLFINRAKNQNLYSYQQQKYRVDEEYT